MRTMQRAAPHYLRSAALDDLILPVLNDRWRTAGQIAKQLGKPDEEVRYRLVKLTAQGKAKRARVKGTNRIVYAYRRAS